MIIHNLAIFLIAVPLMSCGTNNSRSEDANHQSVGIEVALNHGTELSGEPEGMGSPSLRAAQCEAAWEDMADPQRIEEGALELWVEKCSQSSFVMMCNDGFIVAGSDETLSCENHDDGYTAVYIFPDG